MCSGGSRISRSAGGGGRRAVGGVPTSDVDTFRLKSMQKQRNWIPLGGAAGAHRAVGGDGVPTSDVDTFPLKSMQKQRNWIPLGARTGGAPWIRQ